MRRSFVTTLGIALLFPLVMAACGDDDKESGPDPYPPQTSQANVMSAFQRAWRERNTEEYAKLLASDFRFYFDNITRTQNGLPVFWTRPQDSTQVEKLFSSSQVADIAVQLDFPPEFKADAQVGRSRWTYLDVLDVFLAVDLAPTSEVPEGVTLQVQDQRQRFYFRKGTTEADTLAASATASLYFLVLWEDYGSGSSSGSSSSRLTASESNTWGSIKALFR